MPRNWKSSRTRRRNSKRSSKSMPTSQTPNFLGLDMQFFFRKVNQQFKSRSQLLNQKFPWQMRKRLFLVLQQISFPKTRKCRSLHLMERFLMIMLTPWFWGRMRWRWRHATCSFNRHLWNLLHLATSTKTPLRVTSFLHSQAKRRFMGLLLTLLAMPRRFLMKCSASCAWITRRRLWSRLVVTWSSAANARRTTATRTHTERNAPSAVKSTRRPSMSSMSEPTSCPHTSLLMLP